MSQSDTSAYVHNSNKAGLAQLADRGGDPGYYVRNARTGLAVAGPFAEQSMAARARHAIYDGSLPPEDLEITRRTG